MEISRGRRVSIFDANNKVSVLEVRMDDRDYVVLEIVGNKFVCKSLSPYLIKGFGNVKKNSSSCQIRGFTFQDVFSDSEKLVCSRELRREAKLLWNGNSDFFLACLRYLLRINFSPSLLRVERREIGM
ncbi:hypothetical protein AVEN_235860-1 [Araneus ventricosus]|uniref:Uncharacterized protein n=1 Tax=Araneus ventricosus TaxID=182803 RepID=A0A4Y2LLY3_ARAVE|nr:hypothetical protein AVEN_235860-1 [Araneus ventricosus]